MLSDELSEELKAKKYSRFYDFSIENEEFQNIKFQYKALGLIMKSVRNHSVKDTMNYWTLTELRRLCYDPTHRNKEIRRK